LQKEEQNIEKRIKKALDEIRPYLREDKGDVEFAGYDKNTGIVYVRLKGNCSDCPFAIMTLRAGIQRYLISEIDEIYRVEQVK
jgi:Fe-S cluster biogenesis protein NfuA